MYHPTVVERNIARHYDEHKIELKYYSDAHIAEWSAHIASLYDKDGNRTRQLQPEESAFIRNEVSLSAMDFLHWAKHYCKILLNDGGLGPLIPWGSQRIVLDIMGRLELEQYDAGLRGERVNGILIALHKARQLGATMLAQALGCHKLTLNKHIRGLVASINDDKVMIPVSRFERILANLPLWLKPSVGYHEKKGHITFDKLDSAYYIQDFNQMSGLGQGDQYEFGHMTEVASHDSAGFELQHNFFPTIPYSARSLHILESTAQGRGNWWHDFTEGARNGSFHRWTYIFIPWYAEPKKYFMNAPATWIPSNTAMLHAQKVYDTSAEWVGHAVMLSRDQLFWWETERMNYYKSGTLHVFLTNYCATPEESFQHSTQGAFSHEIMEQLRGNTMTAPHAYIIGAEDTQ